MKQKKTRASQWRTIAYPRASAIAYLPAHQNSKCIRLVLIHGAITCDSFKVLAKKSLKGVGWQYKKDPKSYFLTSSDPSHAPGDKFLHHSILLFITFDLICNMTMYKMDFGP